MGKAKTKKRSTAKKKAASKKSRKAAASKQYDDYARLVGQPAKVKDPDDGEVKEGSVQVLGEYDDHGVPHTATFQLRRAVTVLVVDPKDVELLGGNGFEGGY